MRQLPILSEEQVNPFYDKLVRGTIEHKEEIDDSINGKSRKLVIGSFTEN